ncbi:monooxygenase [Plantactinospora sp. BC1]|uniref:monooxygenase n=1 Tax=Plantactinospora sp. BC1 TaxID=2108470 RepID=UPI001F1EA072|nr:monooxygenase [Plantactinospora sp. BC1]
MKNMHRRVRPLVVAAASLAAILLGTSCGADPDAGPPPAAQPSATGTHGGSHGTVDIPPAAPLRSGERFVTLNLAQPYRPAAPNGGTDEYRCFLVDPGLTESAFLTGSQFLPQNGAMVHHAILFRLDPTQVASARTLDAETPGDGWTCFGDAGIGAAAWVAHWAPGANETLLAPGLGYPMPPGSQLVMQVHYNLIDVRAAGDDTDRSGVRLRLVGGPEEVEPLVTELLPAPVELPCAADERGELCQREAALRDVRQRFGAEAGEQAERLNEYCNRGRAPAAGSTQHCDHQVDRAGLAHAVAGHMHLLGRAIRVELNPGSPGARTLLDIPNYDFDQQAVRPLPQPVAVKPGDVLRVTCRHDVTLRQRLPQLRNLPPRYVVWAEGTSDEMCLGIVIMSRPD